MNEPPTRIVEYMSPTDLYFMFISIIFGVFIAVWIEPITLFFPELDITQMNSGELKRSLNKLKGILLQQKMLTGAIMFIMLVCLWWWYGTFLGHVRPAVGYWLYLYDFLTLCSFALAFRFWPHPFVFPITVVVAAALMLGRFFGALILIEGAGKRKRARRALVVAILVLLTYVIFGFGMLALPGFQLEEGGSYIDELSKNWRIYEIMVIALLVVGIFATIVAVIITEGWPFRLPRLPQDW